MCSIKMTSLQYLSAFVAFKVFKSSHKGFITSSHFKTRHKILLFQLTEFACQFKKYRKLMSFSHTQISCILKSTLRVSKIYNTIEIF